MKRITDFNETYNWMNETYNFSKLIFFSIWINENYNDLNDPYNEFEERITQINESYNFILKNQINSKINN